MLKVQTVLLLTLLIFSGASFGSEDTRRKDCTNWLQEHYSSYSHVETIQEYTLNSEYHYRANYNVVPYNATAATIGFDCTIYLTSGKVVAFPSLKPYPQEAEAKPATKSLSEQRMKSGGSACPEFAAWQRFSDEMKKGNYSAKLSSSCVLLEKGDRVFGPIESKKNKGFTFNLISLPGGKRYWIESVSL
jgi:hypothetical protein